MNHATTNAELPPWFTRARPSQNSQESLFKVSLESVLAQAKVSPDELNRWHSRCWISFVFGPIELNDHDDPKILELHFVRDVVRSGLTDAQITQFFDQCQKPHSFDPDRTVFSFRYGMVQVIHPVEPDEPDEPDEQDEPNTVIEDYLDAWIEECDKARLTALHDQIGERLNNLEEDDGG